MKTALIRNRKIQFDKTTGTFMQGLPKATNFYSNYIVNRFFKNKFFYFNKYSLFLNSMIFKKINHSVFRKYMQLWPYHYNFLPFYKFVKNIHLKDTHYNSTLHKDVKYELLFIKRLATGRDKDTYLRHKPPGLNQLLIPKFYKGYPVSFDVKKLQQKYEAYKNSIVFKGLIVFNLNLINYTLPDLNFFYELYLGFLLGVYKTLVMLTLFSNL